MDTGPHGLTGVAAVSFATLEPKSELGHAIALITEVINYHLIITNINFSDYHTI